MALKTIVKVGHITNLSDARYCSGMGVDLLGFSVSPDQPDYIEPRLFQEVRGWLTGPKVVAEIYGVVPDLIDLVSNYAPDYLEVTWENFQVLREKTELPFIVAATPQQIKSMTDVKAIAYWITDLSVLKATLPETSPLLITVSNRSQLEPITDETVHGVALAGSPEIRPGFKQYDELADILEALETE